MQECLGDNACAASATQPCRGEPQRLAVAKHDDLAVHSECSSASHEIAHFANRDADSTQSSNSSSGDSDDLPGASCQNSHFSSVPVLSSEEVAPQKESFREALRQWAVENNIKRKALNQLLKLHKRYSIFSELDLPDDARALLKTPRLENTEYSVVALSPGEYCHFGLAAGLKHSLKFVKDPPSIVSLIVNVDGLPLAKSSRMQLWPIQCRVSNCGEGFGPFVIGAYAGPSKPHSSNAFLRAFVDELQYLLANGLVVNGKPIEVCLKALVCDAPARSFVMMTKGHSGYNGCPKCCVEGAYIGGKVVFPDSDCPLRTNASFRQQHDSEHHRGTSILVELPLDTVCDVPLDYMHVVLLGVVKKLFSLWLSGPLNVRLGPLQRHTFNQQSTALRRYIPREFPRRPRGVDELDRWKAVEFRLLLLYTGPLLLNGILADDIYKHFLLLHASLSILVNKQLCSQHADYAGALLKHFVASFAHLYGKEHMSFNVHCLLHLSDDVKRHGALDCFSAFPFENNMKQLKRHLHKHGKPLQQLANRMAEAQSAASEVPCRQHDLIPRQPCENGPLLPTCCLPCFKTLKYQNFVLGIEEPDNCCMQGEHIIIARNIASMRGTEEICIIGQEFLHKKDFYAHPFESSRLDIYIVSGLSDLKVWPVSNVRKMVKLPWKTQFVVMPELHTI